MDEEKWISEKDFFEIMENEIYEEIKLVTKGKNSVKIKRLSKGEILVTFKKISKGRVVQPIEIKSIENYLAKKVNYPKFSKVINSCRTIAIFRCDFKQKESYYNR